MASATADSRANALRAFSVHLGDQGETEELEHACFCDARGRAVAYRHRVLRALQGLETGHLRELAKEHGALKALSLPSDVVHGQSPHRERLLEEDVNINARRSFLRDLVSSELFTAPDAGVRCTKCGSNDIGFEFLQTRSADEGTTVYCTCKGCRKRWKL